MDTVYFECLHDISTSIRHESLNGKLNLELFKNSFYVFPRPDFNYLQQNCGDSLKVLNEGEMGVLFKKAPETAGLSAGKLMRAVSLNRSKAVELALMTSTWRGMGDELILLTALRILKKKAAEAGKELKISLFFQFSAWGEQVFSKDPAVSAVDAFFRIRKGRYDMIINLLDIPNNDGRQTDLHRYLNFFGVDPSSVPDKDKSNRQVLNFQKNFIHECMAKLKKAYRKIILFHPMANSKLRLIPVEASIKILRGILSESDTAVVTAVHTGIQDERIIDISKLSVDYISFSQIVSLSDAVVSTDTSVIHIADCYKVPNLVFFPTTKPHVYPFYTAMTPVEINDTEFANDISEEMVTELWKSFDYARCREFHEKYIADEK